VKRIPVTFALPLIFASGAFADCSASYDARGSVSGSVYCDPADYERMPQPIGPSRDEARRYSETSFTEFEDEQVVRRLRRGQKSGGININRAVGSMNNTSRMPVVGRRVIVRGAQ
jgi:hypothetical protein